MFKISHIPSSGAIVIRKICRLPLAFPSSTNMKGIQPLAVTEKESEKNSLVFLSFLI